MLRWTIAGQKIIENSKAACGFAMLPVPIAMVARKTDSRITLILLRPNRSASWNDSKRLVILLTVPLGLIAVFWSFAGVWMILPFAGLEAGLLAFFMYRVSHWTYQQQIIRIAPHTVRVEIRGRQNKTVKFPRTDCFVEFVDSENDWPLPRIRLVASAQYLEIGQFLNLRDRQQLREDLSSSGLPVCRRQWWKS
ncbi:DUF2244 domain-containing protein [Alteromonas aestuariivivens]|uniref:DUF2244 domain-containing protein n=1 Tax=Alteromonas aestuariivivens TaxID=1938339 RepID=A0A3D8M4P2_9ALTE|nr:DUF2244 domain-containing protein [Alteromonas aestuariivivens]RDV24659.1 DUF2244 domain-containing protein [Alteromonas aestuariivivens]